MKQEKTGGWLLNYYVCMCCNEGDRDANVSVKKVTNQQ